MVDWTCRQFEGVKGHKADILEMRKDATEDIKRLSKTRLIEPLVGTASQLILFNINVQNISLYTC